MKSHHEGRLEAEFLVSPLVISFVLKQWVTVNKQIYGITVRSMFTYFLFSVCNSPGTITCHLLWFTLCC